MSDRVALDCVVPACKRPLEVVDNGGEFDGITIRLLGVEAILPDREARTLAAWLSERYPTTAEPAPSWRSWPPAQSSASSATSRETAWLRIPGWPGGSA